MSWIDIKEQQPTNRQIAWVFNSKFCSDFGQKTWVARWIVSSKHDGYFVDENTQVVGFTPLEVTHWMPIPEYPKCSKVVCE